MFVLVVAGVLVARNRANRNSEEPQFGETEATTKKSRFHKRKSCEDGDVMKEFDTNTASAKNSAGGGASHGRDPITINPVFFDTNDVDSQANDAGRNTQTVFFEAIGFDKAVTTDETM